MTRDLRISILLGTVALALGGLATWQHFGLGATYQLAKEAAPATPLKMGPLKPAQVALPAWPEFMAVVEKPIFNESRKPEELETEAAEAAPQAPPLTAALTSVLITDTLKMALMRDPSTQKVMRIREGANLEGEFSLWRLVELRPRSAVFEASGNRQELQISAGQGNAVGSTPMAMNTSPTAPVPDPRANDPFYGPYVGGGKTPTASEVQAQPQPQPSANADEIRRRIEERRRQLREEAKRMMEQQKQ